MFFLIKKDLNTIKCTIKCMKKSMSKSTIKRINIENKILNAIQESNKLISTAEIASLLNMSWHTIIRYCLELESRGKLNKIEIGRILVWQIKKL